MIKIAFIIDDISSNGGSERVVIKLINDLIDNNSFSVDVISYKKGVPFYPISDNVGLKFLSGYSKKHRVLNLLKILKNSKYSCLLTIGTGVSVYTYFSTILMFNAPPIIACEHWSHDAPHITFIWEKLRRYVYRRISSIVCLTRTDSKYYTTIGARSIVIPNTLERPDSVISSPLSNKVFLAAGRLSPEKAFDVMINIFYKSRLYKSGWILRIFGDGPEEFRLKKIISDLQLDNYVFINGSTKNIYKEYLLASIFLMTSFTEAMPMVLMESQSVGLPCIVYDASISMVDIVKNNINGYIVKNRDEVEFIDKMIILARNLKLRNNLSENAISLSEFFYTNNTCNLYIKLIKSIINS